MRISIQVKPHAHSNSIEKHDDGYVIHVTALPIAGRANQAAIKVLAEHLNIAPSNITIVSGNSSRRKIVEINESYGT